MNTSPQFEVATSVQISFRPQNYQPGGTLYKVTSDRTSPDYAAFDYEPIASDTVGFTKGSAVLRFLPQTYQADNPRFPLRSLLRQDIRRWEVEISSGGPTQNFEVNAYTCSDAGVSLHLGCPIDALTYPSHPLDQLF